MSDDLREGRTHRRLGLTLFIFSLIAGFGLRFVELDSDVAWLYFAPPFGIFLGALFMYHGKQLKAAARSRAPDALGGDTAPVVYLRPFAGDESGWGQIFSALLTAKMFAPVLSDEEQLAEAVAPIGPLVAIGEPGETLPKPGAVRAYPARWHESVEDLLKRARLVIIRPGVTQGVLWEAQRTFETVSPDRVVVLLKRVKRKDYIRIRGEIAEACGVELPMFAEVRRWRRATAVVEFDADWNPRVLPLKAPYWESSARKPMVDIFKYTLAPVFQRLGAPWQPSPVSTAKVVVAAFLALILTAVAGLVLSALPSGSDGYQFAEDAPAAPADTATPMSLEAAEYIIDDAPPQPRLVAGVQISAPGELQPLEPGLSPNDSAKFESSESHVIRDGRFEMSVTRVDVRPDLSINIVAGAEGVLTALRGTAGVTDMTSTTDTSSISVWPGMRYTASYVMNGEAWFAEGLTFAVGHRVWSILAVVPRSEDTVIATRAVNSVTWPSH